jgi:myosin-5
MAAIAITRESYPNKLPYEVIGERFACLMRENSVNNTDEINSRQQVEYILPKRLNPDSFRCGKTMVYFKAGAKEQLEVLRLEYLNAAATVIQKGVRRVLAMESYSKALKAIFKIQTSWRMTIEKRLLSQKIRSATCLSAAVRRHLATRKVAIVRQERAVTRIQTKFRTIHNAQQLRIARHAAKSIQRYVRRLQALQHIKAFKRALLELQSLWRMRSQLRICNRQKSSATQLASLFRAVLAAKLVVKMRRERDAAMKIQVVARLFITKRKYAYRSHVLSIKGVAASLIQSAYRAHNRRGCNRLLKQGMSAKMAPTEPERSDSCKR